MTTVATDTELALRAGRELSDPQVGVFRRVNVDRSPPDEPSVFTAWLDRSHPAGLTDGVRVPPAEGGCALTREAAMVAAIGEGVERYSAAIYRDAELEAGGYADFASALDPSAVVTFSDAQREAGAVPAPLYEDGDELRWVEGERLADSGAVAVPAQLVYLSYDRGDEPFVRAPISTGLAAGPDRTFAVRRGLLEVVERDAFMLHYLAKSPLPAIRIEDRSGAVGTLLSRLDRAGLEWQLLDARTGLGLPIVVAVLVDRDGGPAVTVAAAARASATDAVRAALEEAIQTRLYQRRLVDASERPPDIAAAEDREIDRETRLRAWSRPEAIDRLGFWLDQDAETTLARLGAELDTDDPVSTVGETWDLYAVDLTTRDVAQVDLTVVRVIAPAAQPLYLHERHSYRAPERLATVPVARGFRDRAPTEAELNDHPHPFP